MHQPFPYIMGAIKTQVEPKSSFKSCLSFNVWFVFLIHTYIKKCSHKYDKETFRFQKQKGLRVFFFFSLLILLFSLLLAVKKVTFLPLHQRGLTHQCYNKTVTLLVAHVVTCMRVDCVFNTYLGKASKQ